MGRKKMLIVGVLLLLGVGFVGTGEIRAQRFPDRPIQLIVPWGPGGPSDLVARVVGDQLGKELKTPVAILNKPGAGGALGAAAAAQAKKDGYTLMVTTQAFYVTAILQPKEVSYDIETTFEPLGRVVETSAVVQVKNSAPWKNLSELLTHIKKNPKKLSCATSPTGTIPHFVWMRLNSLGYETNGVVVQNDPEGISYLSGGHVDFLILSVNPTAPYLMDKSFRGLAVTTEKRVKQFPDIQTFADAGFPDIGSFPTFVAFYAPAGTPKPVVDTLTAALERAMKDPGVLERLEKMRYSAEYLSAAAFNETVKRFVSHVKEMAEKAGIIK
ncbi:MAG: tripartite tricarboxylate transporter substrate binding protein [candidate division WOR-3 bacterium]